MRVPHLVRRVTDPLLRQLRMPVLAGVNRGRRWGLLSAGGGYVTGRRQREQMALIAGLVEPGDCAWDIGAHHGYVTLCAAAAVGRSGSVHAFEPSEESYGILQRHLRWNRVANATAHACALSDFDGEASFGGEHSSKTRTLGGGTDTVPVRRAETLVTEGTCGVPTVVKMDVENAEAHVLAGMLPVLPPHARLLISMHSAEADARCTALLQGAGFELVASRELEASRRGDWSSDPDLVAIGPAVADRERVHSLLRASAFMDGTGAAR